VHFVAEIPALHLPLLSCDLIKEQIGVIDDQKWHTLLTLEFLQNKETEEQKEKR